jgi:chemotaxis protein CheX
VNIVAGNAKKGLENLRIEISLPGVIVGNDYKINWPKGVPVITIPFSSEVGNFSVNVSMKEY